MTEQGKALPELGAAGAAERLVMRNGAEIAVDRNHPDPLRGSDPEWAVRPGEGSERGDVQPSEAPRPRLKTVAPPELLLLTAERMEEIAAALESRLERPTSGDGCADLARACARDLRDGVREAR